MVFNSFEFAIFFVVVTALFFGMPHRYRSSMLLIASCCFYMAFIPVYILILFFTILIDYVAGVMIAGAQGPRRKLFLVISIVANIGVLAIFKYFNFFNENIAALAGLLHLPYSMANLSIALPIGLSFHTFQSLSYTIEVYRGTQTVERNPLIFALYVMFYPQLVAGPIERPQNLLHQFHEEQSFDYDRFVSGLRRMAWGLFKKVVIADRLAIIADAIYANPTEHTGFPLILATYCFAIQIYCDFSGYSDIAIGAARVMGFRLMENFQQPYLATSIPEFWRRWHISLSIWFRDYLYIPLGGSRAGRWRYYLNTLIVFMVSGLWHGASWTFVIWGALHGVYIVLTHLLTPAFRAALRTTRLDRFPWLWRLLGFALTFNLAAFAWVFFRAKSLADAWYIATHLFTDLTPRFALGIGVGVVPALIAGACILLAEGVQWAHSSGRLTIARLPAWARWSGYYTVVMLIVLFGVLHSKAQFIYFQF